MQEAFPLSSGFPGLLWRVELLRSRLSVLNSWTHPLLGQETSRLIKDSQFRKQVVLREDIPLLAEFQDMMALRHPAAVSFHLHAEPEKPLLLQGWSSPESTDVYYGFLKHAFLPTPYSVNGVLGSCQMALTSEAYPVLVVDALHRSVLASNSTAAMLFGTQSAPAETLEMDTFAPADMGNDLIRAARKALEDDIWAGTLFFCNATTPPFSAKVRISRCSSNKADTVVRIALLTTPILRGVVCPSIDPNATRVHASGNQLLRQDLEALHTASPEHLDGLMFSDIHSQSGKVEVYGVGVCFENMEWGARHAYEGTIAQDIERFNLPSLAVEDTLDSIKSIDWVMFIPHNVRSYFALPFYDSNGLHAVLVLASQRPGAFRTDAEARFDSLKAPFEQAIASWRATS